jgi:hypothetical protein
LFAQNSAGFDIMKSLILLLGAPLSAEEMAALQTAIVSTKDAELIALAGKIQTGRTLWLEALLKDGGIDS